ncbi:MAG TPA: hypothetical protein PK413_15315 [Thermoanaerobaculia bacterium]|nr:hypothetical protein [Thermoanaerobaculia bacterium]
MKYHILTLAILAATASVPALAQEQSPCAERNDVLARLKDQYHERPTGVGIMGSGQYTIQEGYAASKLVKAGWRNRPGEVLLRRSYSRALEALATSRERPPSS